MERSPPPGAGEPEDLALRDDLTGAWNRRYLRQLLDHDWAELVATQGTIALLVLDLDFFKEINDAHGHLAGDDVLHRAAQRLRQSFRAQDRLIRYGGDEFVVVLAGAGTEEARALAERARSALATVEILAPESGEALTLPLSFSMGVASFPVDGATGEEVLAVADRRLYEEKRGRRPPAANADRGRRRLLVASGLAVAVLVFAGWVEWRRIRTAPAPPPSNVAGEVAEPAAASAPLAEIVVRDEAELARLRDEVRRLQAELAGPRPADDRALYEARIRELESRLTEAGDDSAPPGAAPPAKAATGPADETGSGMQVGERRTREELELAAPPMGAVAALPEGTPAAGAAASRPGGAGRVTPGGTGVAPRFEPPQLVRAIRPAYPRVAQARRRTATVELKVWVDATGRVLAVEPVGPPAGFGFDESAREAALSAQFRPGRRDGVAVEMETRLAIRFLLEGPPG